MASKIKGLTVVINGETTAFSKAVSKARESVKGLKSELKGVDKLLKVDPTNISMITQKQQLLNTEYSKTKEKLDMLKQAQQQYHDYVGPHTEEEVAQYRNLEREIASTENRLDELREGAIEFGSAASASTLQAKAEYEQLSSTLAEVAEKLMAVSAVTAAIGGYSINAAMEFESSFAGVRKTVDATEAEFNELSDAIRNMALEKPIDVNDINYAAELGGQLGIAVENLEQFASVIADLDVATNLDLEDASLKLAQFANIAGIGEANFDRLGSVIVDLGNNSATTETKIMNMAMRIAGSGSNIGLSAQEVLALATALSSVGIEAEMGGNAISTIMNRIDKDVALNTDTLQVWADTAGMSVEQFKAAWDDSDTVMDAMMAVVDGMAEYRDEGGNLNTLLADMDISYMRQIDTMQRLSRTGDIVNEMVSIANNAWDENIALTREANRRYETTENQLQLVKNNLYECGIQLGEIMLPTVRKVTDGAIDLLQAFQSLDEGTKQTVVTVGALATAAGPLVAGASLLSGGIAKLIGLYASAKTQMMLWTTGMVTANGYIDKQAAAMERAKSASKALNTALNLTNQALVTLAVVGVAWTISEIAKAIEKQKELTKATDGLRDATNGMDESIKNAADAIGSMETSYAIRELKDLQQSIDDTIESQAELTRQIEEEWAQINGNKYAAETYLGVIESLTERYDENGNAVALTREEQERLAAAVAVLNEVCGTNYEVISYQYGVLSESTSTIRENTEMWLLNAEAQAAQQYMTELMVDQYAKRQNMIDAENALLAARIELQQMQQAGYSGELIQDQIDKVNALQVEVDEATAVYNASAEAVENFEKQVADLNERIEEAGPAYDQMLERVHAFSDGLAEVFEKAGVSQEEFVLSISEAGIAVQDFSSLSQEQLKYLIENYDGTYGSIQALMDQFIADNYTGGKSSGQAFSQGLTSSQGEVIASAASTYGLTVDQFAGLAGVLGYEGADAVTQFANGIKSGEASTSWAASVIAAAAKGVANGNSWQWGYHLVQNFVNGMNAAKALAKAAATEVANAVAKVIHFTHPDEGPLKEGTEIYGRHLVEDFALGMTKSTYKTTNAAESMAQAISDTLSPASYSSVLRDLGGSAASSAVTLQVADVLASRSSGYTLESLTKAVVTALEQANITAKAYIDPKKAAAGIAAEADRVNGLRQKQIERGISV